MKIYIASPADCDAVILALTLNGYTVRQGKEKPNGSKTNVTFVEVTGRGID